MLVSALSSENSDVWAAYDRMSWRPKQKLSNYQDFWEFKGVIISVLIERVILFALKQNLDTAVADAVCFHCTGEQLLSDLSLNLFPDNTDNPHMLHFWATYCSASVLFLISVE